MHKREFLRTLGGGALGLMIGPDLVRRLERATPAALAADEPFWAAIRASYRLPADYINLESGYFSMQAQPVLEAFVGHVRMLNGEAAHYMRTVMTANKARVQARVATMAGCGPEELIITRNTTESLDTVIAAAYACTTSSSLRGCSGTWTTRFTTPRRRAICLNWSSIAP